VGATVGTGAGVGAGVETEVGDGDGVGLGEGVGVGVGEGVGVGLAVGEGDGVDVGVATGPVGAGWPPGPSFSGRTATSATDEATTRTRMVSWRPIPGADARTIGPGEVSRNMMDRSSGADEAAASVLQR
jgi:hypothetical protein